MRTASHSGGGSRWRPTRTTGRPPGRDRKGHPVAVTAPASAQDPLRQCTSTMLPEGHVVRSERLGTGRDR